MSMKRARTGKFAGLASLLVIVALINPLLATAAQDGSSGFKAATPQLDLSTPAKPHALQAGIRHDEKDAPKKLRSNASQNSGSAPLNAGLNNFFGKLNKAGGARTAKVSPLKAKTSNGGFNVQAESSVGIIGVKFVLAVGKPPIINRVFPGTPAMDVGMRPHDAIVAVDGVPTYGLTKEEVYDLIIGSPGTPVKVSLMRDGDFRVVNCIRMDINELTDPVVRRDYMMSM